MNNEQRIINAIKEANDNLSITDISKLINTSYHTARNSIADMESRGVVKKYTTRGKRGRPENKYGIGNIFAVNRTNPRLRQVHHCFFIANSVHLKNITELPAVR